MNVNINKVVKPLAILGALYGLSMTYDLLHAVIPYLRPSKLDRYLETKDGKAAWALVTGSNSGIGKAFADELATCGFNVVLLGRSKEKLKATRNELKAKHPTRKFRVIVTLPAHCTEPNKCSFRDIAKDVEDINLNILVNNLGGGMPRAEFGTIDYYSTAELAEHINVMATFPTLLTGALFPALLRGGPGLVINMGSFADEGLPYLPTYGPTKAFLMTSSKELARESKCEGRDVEILGLRVGLVSGTELNKKTPSFFQPHATDFVKSALARVGCGRMIIGAYVPHALQMGVVGLVPHFIKEMAISWVISRRYKAEREGMAKQQ
ncbi:short chain dehydrogenase domain-containing protein [Apiospora saccharicola]|uniref:Short chain dehydrogenase domain-containing protein n=1 Tax=Apiospora saccharicola TaxID=335842 RepID=A0ABR1UX96_9PEZI